MESHESGIIMVGSLSPAELSNPYQPGSAFHFQDLAVIGNIWEFFRPYLVHAGEGARCMAFHLEGPRRRASRLGISTKGFCTIGGSWCGCVGFAAASVHLFSTRDIGPREESK